MDVKQFHQVLQRIAEKHIPNNVDLWSRIERRIVKRKSQRAALPIKRGRSLAFVTAAVAFALVFVAGSYVVAQYLGLIPGFDSGIKQVWRENLGVDLEMSQTIDGVTVTLHRAYADANRIVIYYTASATTSYAPLRIDVDVRLTDAAGHELEQIFGGGGGGGGGGSSDPSATTMWEAEGSHNFDARSIEGKPADLNLHFEMALQIVKSPTYEMAAVGPFTFDFTVPLIPAVIVQPQLTVVTGGIPMTLERAVVTPSSTVVRVCFTIDHPEEAWIPVATLGIGDEDVRNLGFLRIQSRSEVVRGQRCVQMDFLAPYDRQPAQRTLTVQRLQSAPMWNPAALQAGLEAYGIQILIHEDEKRFEIVSAPPNVDVASAIAAVQNSLSEQIDGPWDFTFDLP